MTLRGKKRVLTMLSAALCLSAAGVLAWGFAAPQWPAVSDDSAAVRRKPEGPGTDRVPDRRLASSDFEGSWQRPLRRPLYDPPPPAPKPVKKKPTPPLRARLLATMIEPANSMAMLELSGGDVVFRKVGETIGKEDADATIAEIRPGTVLVRRGEEETRLQVE